MKGMFSPSGTPIRPPTRECTRSALRMAHGGDVSPFTWTHAHAFPAPHGMPRPARRKGCSEMLRVPHETPRPKLPDFTCTYMRLHLCRNPGAAAVQVSPLACLVNKERVGLCAPKDVRRPGFGEGRERVCMQGRYSEKMVSKDTVNAALHMGGTATVALRLVLDVQEPEKRTALLSAPLRGAEQGSPLFRTARSVRDFALPPILKRDDLRWTLDVC